MIFSVMNPRARSPLNVASGNAVFRVFAFTLALLCTALPAFGDKKQPQLEKPMAGPRAAALRVTWLYISPDTSSQKVDRVQIGREMVVAEHSGSWLRVYANTDIQETRQKDAPVVGHDEVTPPVSGWMEANGVVIETMPGGDLVLMGEAANQESLASDPRGPVNAAQSARLLYRRLVEMFPNSPLAAEAAWRAADILWQLQKTDAASRPSARERDPYLRDQMDEEELKKVIKFYPHTRQADLAAFELIDNKLCGDWQGSPKCPEKESEEYEKYAAEYPDGPRTAQALYQAVHRQAVLADMFAADGNDKRSDEAHNHACELASKLKDKFPQSDFTARAAALVFKLDQGISVYGIDRE
jgi:outer membrane protein assembly factor BamD (BamD/ComL family)